MTFLGFLNHTHTSMGFREMHRRYTEIAVAADRPPAVAECGLADLRVHDLRHTAASLMISAGASIKAVQRSLGHASAAITLDRYSHLYDDDLEALADALDERFAEADAAQVRPRRDAAVVELPARTDET